MENPPLIDEKSRQIRNSLVMKKPLPCQREGLFRNQRNSTEIEMRSKNNCGLHSEYNLQGGAEKSESVCLAAL